MSKEKKNIDVITVGLGHSMLVSNLPPTITGSELSDKYFENTQVIGNIDQFGLYDVSMDHYKSEGSPTSPPEYIEPVYRMLSAVTVWKYGVPTEFTEAVLKKSMPLLVGTSIYTDHYASTSNVCGSVKNVTWQNSYSITRNGKKITVPGGINGTYLIDAQSNPKLARGILMNPPSIHSSSVSITFGWEKSHPEMSDDLFWQKVGTFDEHGVLIRRVAKDVVAYSETSLVSNGADPFAKQVNKNGEIILPEKAERSYRAYNNYAEENYNTGKYYYFDFKNLSEDVLNDTTLIINEPIGPSGDNINNKENNQMDKELQTFLESLFGANRLTLSEGQQASQELALQAIEAMRLRQVELENLKLELDSLKEEHERLKASNVESQSFIEIGKEALSEFRGSVKADYIKLAGGEDKADAAIIAVFDNADLKTLKGFKATYSAQLNEKFPMKCDSCGSKEVSRASSVSASEDNASSVAKPKTIAEIREERYRESLLQK